MCEHQVLYMLSFNYRFILQCAASLWVQGVNVEMDFVLRTTQKPKNHILKVLVQWIHISRCGWCEMFLSIFTRVRYASCDIEIRAALLNRLKPAVSIAWMQVLDAFVVFQVTTSAIQVRP